MNQNGSEEAGKMDTANDCLAEVETNTIIGACVMFLVILIAWNLPILRDFIAGLKVNRPLFPSRFRTHFPFPPRHQTTQLLTVGIHELFHLAVGLICGGQVVSICIDPNDGGATHIMGLMRQTPRIPRDPYAMPTFAQAFWSVSAVMTLGAGYFGSSVVGFLFVVSFAKKN